ncbi:MAG TPA: BTAD domain-containing putative transcriptional regulator [Actinospica sp.]|jgi:DNA-binding SARP family transcriptional activator|nr:BTAD domain-containing putative transcriptional regulator [Actinospica sp.]
MRPEWRFGLLGPLLVARDGEQPIPIEAGKQRTLLAALLVDANRTVGFETLIDRIWGETSPPDARATAQNYVARLRRRLGGSGTEPLIVSHPDGYSIRTAPEELDVQRFRADARRASALADSAPDQALEFLDRGLALWRGDPLMDIASEELHRGVARRLVEERMTAIETLLEVKLALGRHAEAAMELTELTQTYPLRERLWEHYLLALYRSGRRGEALAAYRDVAGMLADELGIDPGGTLRDLHQRILADAPDLQPRPPERPASQRTEMHDRPRHVVPRQLPAAVHHFAGRSEELKDLSELLPASATAAAVISVIVGAAGVGKTALAVHWAHQAVDRFPDGQLFVNLRGHAQNAPPREPGEALSGFLRALGVPGQAVPPDQDEAAALYRSLLADRRMLIVLDNAISPHQVRPLLPGGAGCRVLVTSRHRLSGLIARDGAGLLDLDALESVEALELLRRVVGSRRIENEPEPARVIIERCARMPLAVRIAATHLVNAPGLTLAEFRDRLQQAGLLRTLAIEGDEQGGLATTLHLSFRALTAPSARLFALLGLGGFEDYTASSAEALAGTGPGSTVATAIDELVDAHLLTRTGDGRLVLHDLVAEYAVQCSNAAETRQETDAAARRVLAWYTEATKAAIRVIYPTSSAAVQAEPRDDVPLPPVFTTHADALGWLESERTNLMAAVRLASDRGMHRDVVGLTHFLVSYYDLSKRWDDWIATHELAARSAAALGDAAAEARALNYSGVAYQQLGRFEQAATHQERALELCRAAGDGRLEAVVCTSVGVTYAIRGETPRALTYMERALTLHREHGNADGETIALNNLAEVQTELGMHTEALAGLEEALAIAVRLGNNFNIRVILCSLGVLYGQVGRHDDSVESFRRAIETGSATHDRYGVAETLGCLGDLLHRDGKINEAHLRWKEAAELFDAVGPQQAAALRERTADCCGPHGFTPQPR